MQLLNAINEVKRKHRLYAAIYNMDFLRRSGRVSTMVATLGSLLQIKPIITVLEDGKVESVHRIRTFKKALGKLRENCWNAEGQLDRLAIIHTQDEDGAKGIR